jgi:hypothetical protein
VLTLSEAARAARRVLQVGIAAAALTLATTTSGNLPTAQAFSRPGRPVEYLDVDGPQHLGLLRKRCPFGFRHGSRHREPAAAEFIERFLARTSKTFQERYIAAGGNSTR